MYHNQTRILRVHSVLVAACLEFHLFHAKSQRQTSIQASLISFGETDYYYLSFYYNIFSIEETKNFSFILLDTFIRFLWYFPSLFYKVRNAAID